jgi:putative oxidoreductase
MVDSHQGAQAAARHPNGRATIVTANVARIFLGLIFSFAGVSGFVLSFGSGPPAQPGLAGEFQDVFFRSHWVLFVDAFQLLAGLALLANRYVPLALTVLGAVLVNILAFHLTMQPQTIAFALVTLAACAVLAYRYRANLAPLFEARAPMS